MTRADFRYMLVQHGEVLHPYAFSLTQNHEDARDLYQETMLRALLYEDKYEFGTNLKAWLYTIMRNIFINNYHRNKKTRTVEYIETYNDVKTTGNNGWIQLRLEEIKKAIGQLPDIFRLAFELYYTGYKYQEIASLLCEPMGTVKSRIHFARKMLTSQLER